MTQTTSGLAHTIPLGFVANVAQHGEQVALRERQSDGTYRQWTYAQYADQVARCAAGLRALGFGPGERLVLMLRNRPVCLPDQTARPRSMESAAP